jgi:hypothetical protein
LFLGVLLKFAGIILVLQPLRSRLLSTLKSYTLGLEVSTIQYPLWRLQSTGWTPGCCLSSKIVEMQHKVPGRKWTLKVA